MSKKITDTMLTAIEAIADQGGSMDLRNRWQRPAKIKDVKDNTFIALETRGLATIRYSDPYRSWGRGVRKDPLGITLTTKGWTALKARYARWSYELKAAQKRVAARLLLVQWLDMAEAEGADTTFSPEALFRRYFNIRDEWTLRLQAHYSDAGRFSLRLECLNVKVAKGEVNLDSSGFYTGTRWLSDRYGEKNATPDNARRLADILLDAARLAEELDIAADEQGYIDLDGVGA